MKPYMRNRDFIPEKFYNKMQLNTNKKESTIIILFIIINLLLSPITVKNMSRIKESPTINKNNYNNKFNLDNVNIWVRDIMTDDIEEIHITNDSGEILISDLNKIDRITSKKLIKVCDISLAENKKYKLGVSLHD